MLDGNSECIAVLALWVFWTLFAHTNHVLMGMAVVKLCVSMHQPKKTMILLKSPSAVIFPMNAGSSRWVGLSSPASGQKLGKRAMTNACLVRCTLFQFSLESRIVVTPSSIYLLVPPLTIWSSFPSASSGTPNMDSSTRWADLGGSGAYGNPTCHSA